VAQLDNTTARPEVIFSLSSQTGGEGRGEEATFMECPLCVALAHSFLAERAGRILKIAAGCARHAVAIVPSKCYYLPKRSNRSKAETR